MKLLITVFTVITLSIGCKQTESKKMQVLDSLKKAYADKPIHITLNNNPSGSVPITNQYAYTDIHKSDLAFKIESWYEYKVAYEEGYEFVPTTDKMNPEVTDMVLVEIVNAGSANKRGFIPYKFIEEFKEVSYFEH